MLPGSTASSLIHRLQNSRSKDETARTIVCRLYGPLVESWAIREMRLQSADAQDFTQEVLLTALEKINNTGITTAFAAGCG